jgi:hypothetical protein
MSIRKKINPGKLLLWTRPNSWRKKDLSGTTVIGAPFTKHMPVTYLKSQKHYIWICWYPTWYIQRKKCPLFVLFSDTLNVFCYVAFALKSKSRKTDELKSFILLVSMFKLLKWTFFIIPKLLKQLHSNMQWSIYKYVWRKSLPKVNYY